MSPEISEHSFEEAIECALLAHGPDAFPGDDTSQRDPTPIRRDTPGRLSSARSQGIRPQTLPAPARRARLHLCHPAQGMGEAQTAPRRRGERALSGAPGGRGRQAWRPRRIAPRHQGLRLQFRLAYFRPASGLNAELQRLYEANLFTVVRQLRYSEKNENSLDLVLFLNGLPLFTAELKNPLTGQNVQDAMRQYRYDRDPQEPLLAFRRCLAHFAVDPDLVYVTTRLAGRRRVFYRSTRASSAAPAIRPNRPPRAATPPTTCGAASGRGTAC